MSSASKSRVLCVSDVMTSQVRTAAPGQSLDEIGQMFTDERCHHVPIVERGRPVGMVSARDLVRVTRKRRGEATDEEARRSLTAGDVMSTDLHTIQADAPIDEAIDRIGHGDIHALIVIDVKRDLAGIVTHRDLLHYLLG